jgi:hypothetical protein
MAIFGATLTPPAMHAPLPQRRAEHRTGGSDRGVDGYVPRDEARRRAVAEASQFCVGSLVGGFQGCWEDGACYLPERRTH